MKERQIPLHFLLRFKWLKEYTENNLEVPLSANITGRGTENIAEVEKKRV
jgi:hypothetical protein